MDGAPSKQLQLPNVAQTNHLVSFGIPIRRTLVRLLHPAFRAEHTVLSRILPQRLSRQKHYSYNLQLVLLLKCRIHEPFISLSRVKIRLSHFLTNISSLSHQLALKASVQQIATSSLTVTRMLRLPISHSQRTTTCCNTGISNLYMLKMVFMT